MTLTYRRAAPTDLAAVAFADGVAFSIDYTDADLEDFRPMFDPERFIVAEDDASPGDIVGVAGDFPFAMTVPADAGPARSIEVPGVTWVSVRMTHRRQGILRELMTRQLTSYKDAGISVAILTASEGGIYGRFGYGAATHERRTIIDTRRAVFADPDRTGEVRLVSAQTARAAAPDIHERWRATTPGAVSRSSAWWDHLFLDRPQHRQGKTAQRYLLHPDGYVSYQMQHGGDAGIAQQVCWVTDCAAVTPEAHRALWQVVLNLDLTGSVQTNQLPIDDPLPHLLTDPRQVRTTALRDGLWLRPLDVAELLSVRRYAIEIDTVIAVADPLFGDGRFHLRGGPDGAECRPTDALAEVALDIRELGSAYLGGVRLVGLARAGRVDAEPTLLTRLDRAFLCDRAPFHGTSF